MEIKQNYLVRLAADVDIKRIWEIRNHEVVRKNSHNQDRIDFATHQSWFCQKYFSPADNQCFVLAVDKKVIGYCRFDTEGKEYIISIAIDPVHHGQGWGKILLSLSLEQFRADKPIVATIARDNEASLKLFQKYNFKIYKQDNGHYYLLFGGVNW